MVRDMCGIVLQLLGIAELGLEDLKKLTKTAQTPVRICVILSFVCKLFVLNFCLFIVSCCIIL